MRNSGSAKKEAKYGTQDTYPKSIISPLAFHQCPSLLYGTCLFHNNHKQWIWPQKRKTGRSKGILNCFHIMELLLSCRVSRDQDNTIVPSYDLYAERGAGGMGLTTQTRSCQLASSHQGHPQGPHCSDFQFCTCHGDRPEGLKQDPRNWPRADTHKHMTQLFNYLAMLSPLRPLLQEGHLPSLKEMHLFWEGRSGRMLPVGKGQRKLQ